MNRQIVSCQTRQLIPRLNQFCTFPVARIRRLHCSKTEETGPSSRSNSLQYENLLLAIADSNPYLSDGSRQALSTVADLVTTHQSKLTVVVIHNDEGTSSSEKVRFETLSKELHEFGCTDFDVFTRDKSETPSVVLGDMADEIKADLVVLSSDAVHEKSIDANLLAEFMSCPFLIVP
eukprot:g4158.t1